MKLRPFSGVARATRSFCALVLTVACGQSGDGSSADATSNAQGGGASGGTGSSGATGSETAGIAGFETAGSASTPGNTPVCTSMKTWTGGNRESPLMRPGHACRACHEEQGEGPLFAVAGTVFPTPHEPDDCNGVGSASGARVVVTDAAGNVHVLPVNEAGNFFFEARTFATPYHAKVMYQGRERPMAEAQTNGDCNVCHTPSGQQNAPGRIFLP